MDKKQEPKIIKWKKRKQKTEAKDLEGEENQQ